MPRENLKGENPKHTKNQHQKAQKYIALCV